jgi:hypothetical protein
MPAGSRRYVRNGFWCRLVAAIADFRLLIADWRNSKLEIRHSQKARLPLGEDEFRFSNFDFRLCQSTFGN